MSKPVGTWRQVRGIAKREKLTSEAGYRFFARQHPELGLPTIEAIRQRWKASSQETWSWDVILKEARGVWSATPIRPKGSMVGRVRTQPTEEQKRRAAEQRKLVSKSKRGPM